ncbi:MAG: hypothetical protein LCI00_09390 [Chloroflexi bacterium]|nr:hypothetical protein [Chloroflexota bacterium]MCC6893062.1 hypothetical protein [Anaerolineae bacterium]
MHHAGTRSLKISVLVLLLLGLNSTVFAQEATPEPSGKATAAAPTDYNLTYSVTVESEITNETFSEEWTLMTASADRLMVQVERTSGNLLPDVSILDANKQQIAQSYGPDQTGAGAEIANFTLPTAGTFTVLVQRANGGTGITTGGYTLLVTPLATAQDNPNNTISLGEVTAGTPINGELTATQWYQRYTYNAAGEDVIRVVANRTSGTLYPEVEILDVNDSVLQTGYVDYSRGDAAQINYYELAQAGTYTIVITRDRRFNGNTVGTYQLDVTLLGAGESNPMMAQPMGAVEYDTPLTGEIGAQWYQDWTLTTTAADVLSLTVNRTSGNLQPEVILLGGSGQELTHGYTESTGDHALIDHYTLTGPGTYTVRVSRSQGKRGFTTGGYSLTIALNGTGADSDSLAEPSGAIENTQEQTGTITHAKWANTWTYSGTQGDVIDISVARGSALTDTLIPYVDIRDSNGQVIRTGYPGDSRDTAEITSFTLPGTGTYQIVVYRDRNQDGYTVGDYTLSVEPTAQ